MDVAHAAPAVFAPLARLELLSWSPLFIPGGGDGPAPPLDGMAWYVELLEYGGALDADDPDGNLVPTLVEKLVAPTVARAAELGWDPASAAQSRRLAGVVKDLLVYLDPNASDVMARVLVAVAKRLLETAETRCDIPGWAPVATSAAAAAAHVRRQFGVALRCARAATAWTGILPAADLAAVVHDAIVVQRVVPHLRLALARPGNAWRASSASPLPRRASGSSPRGPSPRRSGRCAREPGGALGGGGGGGPGRRAGSSARARARRGRRARRGGGGGQTVRGVREGRHAMISQTTRRLLLQKLNFSQSKLPSAVNQSYRKYSTSGRARAL